MKTRASKKLGNWADVERCTADGCRGKCTHVIFLNTPTDIPYVVGACTRHKVEPPDFPYITKRKFDRVVAKLRKEGIDESDLAMGICVELDEQLNTISEEVRAELSA